ncbi:DUF4397 domain-containing protein [Pedobacter alpinus]|uniref:DUF4397 domain-containing protein n=1 Tax=Pedobacter alpinus TaxID=1590643 RepID=A0ABW5TQ70_9SPHI
MIPKISNSSFKYLFSLLLIAVSIAFNSCKLEEVNPLSGEAKIRIINASPEANQFSFFINDTLKTGQALNYGEASPYINISAGSNSVYTKLDNSILSNTNLRLFLSNNTNYTLFLAGKASKDSLIYVSTSDNLSFGSDTTATVRFINVSPNSQNLNLVFQTSLVDSVNVISSINYRSASNYIRIKPNIYFLRIKRTGSSASLANLDGYNLQAGKVYTFWAKGLVNTTGTFALNIGSLTDN